MFLASRDGVLEASWGRLGGILGHLAGVLEASWGRLGGVLGRLGESWGRLGSSWEHLGEILAPTWTPKPSQNTTKLAPKSIQVGV